MFHKHSPTGKNSLASTASPALWLAFTGLLSLLPLFATILPRSLAYGPGLIGVTFFILVAGLFRQRPSFHGQIWLMAGIILALAFASVLWSIDPDESLDRCLKLTSLFLPGLLLLEICLTPPGEALNRFLWIFAGSVIIAILLINIEYLFDYPLYRFVRGIQAGEVPGHELNRGSVVCVLLLFPAVSIMAARINRDPLLVLAGFAIFYLPALAMTESQSAQLAALAGAVTLLFFPFTSGIAWRLLTILVVAGILLAPIAAIWLFSHYASEIHAMPALGEGGAHAGNRMEVWDFISRYALQKPLYGHGIEATRAVEAFETREIFQKGTTILHPHNFAIQVWMEFGLIGVVVFSGLLVHILNIIRSMPIDGQKSSLPAFVALLSVALTGYGLWQSWWIGLIYLVIAIIVLTTRAGFTSNPK